MGLNQQEVARHRDEVLGRVSALDLSKDGHLELIKLARRESKIFSGVKGLQVGLLQGSLCSLLGSCSMEQPTLFTFLEFSFLKPSPVELGAC